MPVYAYNIYYYKTVYNLRKKEFAKIKFLLDIFRVRNENFYLVGMFPYPGLTDLYEKLTKQLNMIILFESLLLQFLGNNIPIILFITSRNYFSTSTNTILF